MSTHAIFHRGADVRGGKCPAPFQGSTYFVDHLCSLFLVSVMLSRLFIAALWSLAGKRLTPWLSFVMFNCVLTRMYTTWIGNCYRFASNCFPMIAIRKKMKNAT